MKQDFINNNLQREPITAAAAIGMGITAASAGGQIYAQGKMNKKTREWNERMYAIQRKDAIADRDYNSSKEQMKRLKEAGLNPALIYGDSGAGAVTQTRGSAPGSWNPQVAPIGGMGIQATQSIAQLQLLKAQTDNINADTKNKLGDAANKPLIGQNIEASTTSLQQGVENAKAQQKLTEIQTDIAGIEKDIKTNTFNDVISKVYQEQKIAYETMRSLKLQNNLTEETFNTKVAIVKAEYGYLLAQKAGIEAGIQVDKAQVTQIINKITQDWQSLEYQGKDVSERQRAGAHSRWINDVTESTKLTYEAAEKILQAIGLSGVGSKEIKNIYLPPRK